MVLKIYIMKKTHTLNGNPNYKLFIPQVSGKQQFMRQHKEESTYGIVSYNLASSMRRVFPGQAIEIIDKR